MSQALFPVLPGLTFNAGKSPEFSTKVQRAASGSELRAAFRQYPLWTYKLTYEFLRTAAAFAELQTLGGFFLARKGRFDSFLFSDPDDNAVTDQQFGIGDGTTRTFQLLRGFGGFLEPVQNVNVLTNIKKSTVTQTNPTHYSIDSAGMVTFVTAPAIGAALTWTGSYYFRVRFVQDAADFNKFMQGLWELKGLEFVGSPMNKV